MYIRKFFANFISALYLTSLTGLNFTKQKNIHYDKFPFRFQQIGKNITQWKITYLFSVIFAKNFRRVKRPMSLAQELQWV